MPTFYYQAKKGLDEIIEGSIEADDETAALHKISQTGLYPLNIGLPTSKTQATNSKGKTRGISQVAKKKKIKDNDILIFTQQFRSLIRSKMELLESLDILHQQTENQSLREVISEVYTLIKKGENLSAALEEFPQLFPKLYISIVKAGEASGRLDDAFERIRQHYQRQDELRSKVIAVLIYPSIMAFVGIITIIIFIYFIIPRLGAIFDNSSVSLPFVTNILLKMGKNPLYFWLTLGGLSLILIIGFSNKGKRKKVWQTLKENLPLLRGMTKDEVIVSFTQSLASLVASKMPIVESLEVAMLTVESPVLVAQLKLVLEDIASGELIAKSLEKRTFFPKFFIRMIAVGEGSGRLEEVLNEISEAYLQQLDRKLRIFTALLEPIIILVIGCIVGFLIMAMMLPILQMNQLATF
ncbi:MAG: type II secretion system F family protein [bacterium]